MWDEGPSGHSLPKPSLDPITLVNQTRRAPRAPVAGDGSEHRQGSVSRDWRGLE